jgi:GNAT superfamily N-acetyltransferase
MLAAMHVRPRQESDVDPLLEMAHVVKELDGYPPRGPIDVASFLAPRQQLCAWVAEDNGVVVGHVALHSTGARVTMDLASRHTHVEPHELVLVARVLVGPTARRVGVAHALLDAAVTDAHRRGRRPILDVATELHGAVSLYESCGWDRAGEVTIDIDDEPSLRCYVYVGPAPGPDEDAAVTTVTRR